MAAHQAQGPLRRRPSDVTGAGPLGAVGRARRASSSSCRSRRMPAATTRARRARSSRCPRSLAPMLAEIGERAVQSPGLDVGAEARRLPRARVHRRATACSCARGAGSSSRRSFRGSSRSSPARRSSGMILDGEIVAFDATASRRSTRCRTARSSRPSARSPRPTKRCRSSSTCFDLLHFAGIDLRSSTVRRPPALSRAMPAALAARAARACGRGRRRAARGGASRAVSRASSASARTAATSPAGARRRGSRSSRRKAPTSSIGGYTRARARAARSARSSSATGTTGKLRYASHVGLRLRRPHARSGEGDA